MDKIDILIGRLATENCSGKKVIPLNLNGLARFKEEIYKLITINEVKSLLLNDEVENYDQLAQRIIDLLKK